MTDSNDNNEPHDKIVGDVQPEHEIEHRSEREDASATGDEQTHIQNAMQRRFERIAERTQEARRKIPTNQGEVFAKVEAAIANLTGQGADPDRVSEPPSPRAALQSDAAQVHGGEHHQDVEMPELRNGAPERDIEHPAQMRTDTFGDTSSPQDWSDETAEALTRHYETEGHSTAEPEAPALETPAPDTRAGASRLPSAPGNATTSAASADDRLVARFDALAARLDSMTGGDISDTNLALLVERLGDLEARIDNVLSGGAAAGGEAAGGSLHDIELCIAELATQLEATNAEVGRLAEIEQQITEFTQRFADSGAAAPPASFDPAAIADLVAERMASRPIALSAGGDTSYGELEQSGIGELTAMMKDFMSERRTEGDHANAVLDTMQQTIMRLLDRMDALESGRHAAAKAVESWAEPEAADVGQEAVPARPQSSAAAAQRPQGPASQPVDDDLFDDEEPAPAFGRRASAAEAAQSEHDGAPKGEQDTIDRLERVVGELENDRSGAAAPQRAARRPASSGARPKRSGRKPIDPVADRSRFVDAARAAAASANQRLRDEIEEEGAAEAARGKRRVLAGSDVPVPGKSGRKKKAPGKASAKSAKSSSTRTRLLVAALALLVVGLGATKLLTNVKISLPGLSQTEATRSVTSVEGTTTSGPGVTPTAVGSVPVNAATPTPTPVGPAGTGATQFDAPSVAGQFAQPAAIDPGADAAVGTAANQNVGGVSRQALPSAMVGPLSLRLAAANGDPSAQFEVAARFAEGRGVTQDFKEAVKWYQRSAGSGFALSQYRLGTLYERGLGVDKDIQRARVWYERAAAKGNVKAMHNLAVLAASNAFGKPDYTKAARWFTAAAEHGLGDSQFNLAILYQHGLGVPQDEEQAYRWFSLAAMTGDQEAGKRKTVVAATLGTAKTSQIDRAVSTWMLRPADKLANDPHVAGHQWQRNS